MQDLNERPVCHRAEDLVTYLFGEASEAETADFAGHLQQCVSCKTEFAVFNQVHDSVRLWRDEALGKTFSSIAAETERAANAGLPERTGRRISAMSAVREFFTVSPLWLRGATAFAGLLLCALLVFTMSRLWEKPNRSVNNPNEARFTQADIDKAVAQARKQAGTTQPEVPNQSASLPEPPSQTDSAPPKRIGSAVSRKPRTKGLTHAESEQLAADLRLVPVAEEEDLNLVLPEQDDQK